MHIEPDEKIGGFPTVEVRRLMRKAAGRSITVRYVRETLDCSISDASCVLRHLQKAGFVESVGSHLERSTKGSALAIATAARPGPRPCRK